jgi:CobQ-like glutamine amidotransferase family enzyme
MRNKRARTYDDNSHVTEWDRSNNGVGMSKEILEPEEASEVELDDADLAVAAGGQMVNSTEIVYASTFVPFDSSF